MSRIDFPSGSMVLYDQRVQKGVRTVNNLMTIVLLVAVLIYSVVNYVTGKTSLVFFLICVLALSVPLLKMLSILFQEWKNR